MAERNEAVEEPAVLNFQSANVVASNDIHLLTSLPRSIHGEQQQLSSHDLFFTGTRLGLHCLSNNSILVHPRASGFDRGTSGFDRGTVDVYLKVTV